jgi:hypothetical protein
MIATSSGVRSLREYLQLHSAIGEPAVRKISRQVIKGAFCSQKCMPARPHPLVDWPPALPQAQRTPCPDGHACSSCTSCSLHSGI